jgi:hypothetical protein
MAAGFRQFLAQLVDLFGQRLVLLFQAVETIHDFLQIGGNGLGRKDSRRQ